VQNPDPLGVIVNMSKHQKVGGYCRSRKAVLINDENETEDFVRRFSRTRQDKRNKKHVGMDLCDQQGKKRLQVIERK
jgi:hypothetical protein